MGSTSVRVFIATVAAALIVLVGFAVPGEAVAAPPATPVVTVVGGCDGTKQVQPRNLSSIYCGDAGVIVTQITWLGWTDAWAAGYGTEHRRLCKPDCATGGIRSSPVAVWLFAPSRGEFTRVSLYSSVTAAPETYRLTGFVR
ncbi:hypothetical protein [Gordonia lacunae]|uniref:Secreted protein n=1 Tax=Gordonia lacunae TaxID=417102 RepID=A0A2C9ZJK9_9ACTN|nr:hypothetical protein [Gordonia lacunae]OUC77952.1 hypothetical protein CA982_14695 [Gordonia lacunae]